MLLCAHIDTVEPTAPIEPVLVDGGWENAHDGILGADNKAALAVMLEVARRVDRRRLAGRDRAAVHGRRGGRAGGRQGVRRLAPALRFGYVFDHATPIGEVVVASPTAYRLEAEFHGKAAHAGIRPEDGRSAIVAAARAIAAMPLGRIDDETTANVGSVHGGVGTTNVVPERCRLVAEARSLDAARVEDVVSGIVDALYDGAAQPSATSTWCARSVFHGYRVRADGARAGGGRGRAARLRLRAAADRRAAAGRTPTRSRRRASPA